MFDTKPIVRQLKSYIEEHGMTQTELAKRLATSNPTLSRWLNGRTSFNPTLKQLISIADMFGVTLIELLSQGKTVASTSSEKAATRTGKTAKSRPAAKTSTKAASTGKKRGRPKKQPSAI